MRSNLYDYLPNTINFLKKKINEQADSNQLIKSTNYGPDFGSVAQDFADKSAELIKAAKQIYKQFSILRNDYQSGLINFVTYKNYLQPLNTLLTEGDQILSIPGFDPTEIIKELKRVGY